MIIYYISKNVFCQTRALFFLILMYNTYLYQAKRDTFQPSHLNVKTSSIGQTFTIDPPLEKMTKNKTLVIIETTREPLVESYFRNSSDFFIEP